MALWQLIKNKTESKQVIGKCIVQLLSKSGESVYSNSLNSIFCVSSKLMTLYNWKPPRKIGLTPVTIKVRIVRFAVIQAPQFVLGVNLLFLRGIQLYE